MSLDAVGVARRESLSRLRIGLRPDSRRLPAVVVAETPAVA